METIATYPTAVDNKQVGIFKDYNGQFLAMTLTTSKKYKTLNGAVRFFTVRGYVANTKTGEIHKA